MGHLQVRDALVASSWCHITCPGPLPSHPLPGHPPGIINPPLGSWFVEKGWRLETDVSLTLLSVSQALSPSPVWIPNMKISK